MHVVLLPFRLNAYRALELLAVRVHYKSIHYHIVLIRGVPLNPSLWYTNKAGGIPATTIAVVIDYCANRIHCYFTRWLAEPWFDSPDPAL